MTLPPIHLFSKPYDSAPELSPKEVFFYRIIHREFSKYMEENISDEFFIDCMNAALESHAGGPAPWCSFLLYAPFYHVNLHYNREKPSGVPTTSESIKVLSFFQREVCEYPSTPEERKAWIKNLDEKAKSNPDKED